MNFQRKCLAVLYLTKHFGKLLDLVKFIVPYLLTKRYMYHKEKYSSFLLLLPGDVPGQGNLRVQTAEKSIKPLTFLETVGIVYGSARALP